MFWHLESKLVYVAVQHYIYRDAPEWGRRFAMTFNNATLVFDVFNVGATRSGSSIWKKIKEGVIRYGTARAENALRNGHIY